MLKPKVEGENACRCAKCGKLCHTNRLRPEFLCIRCYIEKGLGRPLTKDDIKITKKGKP